jgi:hypothetical protein
MVTEGEKGITLPSHFTTCSMCICIGITKLLKNRIIGQLHRENKRQEAHGDSFRTLQMMQL